MGEVYIMTYYEELFKKFGYVEGQVGVNELGEHVIVSIDEDAASVRTLQRNGWMRINIYYEDGGEEETYER